MKKEIGKKPTRAGYILILTLMIIALSVIIVTGIIYKVRTYVPFVHTSINTHKARSLAYSGIQIALSQLFASGEIKKQQPKSTPPVQPGAPPLPSAAPSSLQGTQLSSLLPLLNTWQTVQFTKARDGFQGEIKYYIACEEGKINLNAVYDFKNKKYIKTPGFDGQKIVQELCAFIEKITGAKELFNALDTFLKGTAFPLYEVTQLCKVTPFGSSFASKIYVNSVKEKPATPAAASQTLALSDIFTTTSDKKINPWVLSQSLVEVAQLKNSLKTDDKDKKKKIQEAALQVTNAMQWPDDWNKGLRLVYEKEWANLPAFLKSLFDTKFGLHHFSVVSYGTIGEFTQKIYAIGELIPRKDDKYQFDVRIIKLYWL